MDLQELRAHLESIGFRFGPQPARDTANRCGWYAWRRSEIESRPCECNDDKPGVQLVIVPWLFEVQGLEHASCEIELTGQRGAWYRLKAYGVKFDELPDALQGIEAALVRAWNAL